MSKIKASYRLLPWHRICVWLMTALIAAMSPMQFAIASGTVQERRPARRATGSTGKSSPTKKRHNLAELTKPVKRPFKISANPSDLEILKVRLFPQPLIPMDTQANAAENRDLGKALMMFKNRRNPEDISALTGFLETHPKSRWSAALEVNIAQLRFETGYLTDALKYWSSAWESSRLQKDQKRKAVADQAISNLVLLEARLGLMESLEKHLSEIGNRTLTGTVAEKVKAGRNGLWGMKHHPETSFKCGPFALKTLTHLNSPSPSDYADYIKTIKKAKSTTKGTNLAQVQDWSQQVGLKLQMAKRSPGAKFITPAVMHWRVGHFAAITAQDHNRYRVQDSTFAPAGSLWLSQEALESETDGYFLVPQGSLPSGWQPITRQEAETVWGKGLAIGAYNSKTDSEPHEPCPAGGGMASASAFSMNATLSIVDYPLSYSPPVGPSITIATTYNYNEGNQPSTFTFTNLGPDWSLNWVSYLTVDMSQNITVRVRGGGSETYNYADSTYVPNLTSQAQIVDLGGGSYQRLLPDGSIENFTLSDGTNTYMTSVVDPQGNAAIIAYDEDFRVTSITDAAGNAPTTFAYVSDTPLDDGFYKVASITDGFSRSVTFTYDQTTTFLTSITDAAGNISEFVYDTDNSFINMMTTPYGITTFYQYTPQGGDPEYPPTGLITTLPDGSRTIIENWIGEEKSTYFWDKEATALYPNDPANHNYQHCKTTRWLWDSDTFLQAPVASWTRKPLEAPIVYTYPGELVQDFVGTSNKPTQIARQLAGFKYTATISGTVTEDDTLGITIVDGLLPAALKTFQYTVQSGDTLNSIAVAFATSINSDPTMQAFGLTATAAANTLIITSWSTNYTVYLEASEGSPTETITFDLGPNPIITGFLGAQIHASDVFTITVYDAGLPGGEEAVSHTVQSTDSLVSIVQSLAISINANANLQAIGVKASCPVAPMPQFYSLIELQSNSQNATTYVASASEGAHGSMDLDVVHYNGLVQEWNYERNDLGYITKAVDPLSRTLEYSYDANNIDLLQVQCTTTSQNFVLGQWQYDDPYAPHRPTLFIDSSGQQTAYTYNGFAELATVTDAQGNTSTRSYDGSGYLTQIQGPLVGSQDISTFTFYPYGPVHTATNSEGYTRTFSYDNLNRLTNIAYPDGTSEQIIYDRLDAIMRSDRLGRWTTYAYDSLDKLISDTDPLGRKTEYSWCRCGSLAALTDPANHTTRWQYDLSGRIIRKMYADESTVNYVYEPTTNRLQSSTDALNQSTHFFYNPDNTLSQKVYFNAVNATSQVITTYDPAFPRVTTVSNGWGTYSYSYNPYIEGTSDTAYIWIGGLPQIPNATDTIDITFTNSALYGGQYAMPTYTVDAGDAGQPAQVATNLADAITANVTLSTAGISATAQGTLVTISASSPVSVVTTASGSTTATVGGGGRLAQITNSVMPDSAITFSYDSLGRTTNQMINGGNNSTAWTYDEISRVTQEVNPLGTFTYDYIDNVPGYSKGSSRLEKITYPNSQTANFSWYGTTQDLRLKEINNLTGGANPLGISRFTYAYNPVGEITKWLQQQQQHKVNYDLAYDEAGQLTGAGAGAATEAPPYVRQYQYNYDLAANRSSAQRESLQYARLGGTATIDDELTVTATDPALGGGTQAVSYTVQSGDTLTTIAANLAVAVTASTAMQAAGISAVSDSTTVTLRSVSPNETTYLISLSGGATETVSTGLNRSLENITLGGSAQAGDVVTIRVRDASLGGGYQDVTYTVVGGDTLQDIATQLAVGFSGLGANFSATAVDKVITVESLSPNVTNYTSMVTGSTPKETVAISAVLDGAETFHIGGTKTTSDTISIIVNDIGLAGGTETVTYTVQGGDTLTTIAAGIAAAINANSNLKALSLTATSSGTVVRVVSSSKNATTYLTAKSADATETISVGMPSNGVVPATIAGTKTTSDVLTITVYDAGLTGGFKAIDYTVVGGDTINSIGTNLAAAITADSDLIAIGVSATAANPTPSVSVVNLLSTSLNATTYVSSVSDGATETLTLAPTVGVVQATHNDVNELTGLAAGGPTRFQGTTDRPGKPVTIASAPATMLSSQSFTGSSTLASGANSVSIVAESGGGTTTTNAYKVRVASTSPSTLTYDANGNMTDDGTNSFEWDAENRLIKIIYPGSNNFTEFTYDALGRRVKIVETTADSVTSTQQFVYNGNEICEERDAYNAVTKEFLALGWTDGTNNHFYGLNHLGSKTEVTDASGNIEEQSSYTPFGVQTLLQGSATSDFGYAGMYTHQRSKLNLTWFRAYSSTLGRWLSRDPLSSPNDYNYARNNSITFVDQLGLLERNIDPYGAGLMTPANWNAVGMNMVTADAMGRSTPAVMPIANDAIHMMEFANLVRTGGEWDYAGVSANGGAMGSEDAIAMGNINFGATGTILGISSNVLHSAGNSDQIVGGIVGLATGRNTIDWRWVRQTGGDRPADSIYIDIGIELGKAKLQNPYLDPVQWFKENYPKSKYPQMYPCD